VVEEGSPAEQGRGAVGLRYPPTGEDQRRYDPPRPPGGVRRPWHAVSAGGRRRITGQNDCLRRIEAPSTRAAPGHQVGAGRIEVWTSRGRRPPLERGLGQTAAGRRPSRPGGERAHGAGFAATVASLVNGSILFTNPRWRDRLEEHAGRRRALPTTPRGHPSARGPDWVVAGRWSPRFNGHRPLRRKDTRRWRARRAKLVARGL